MTVLRTPARTLDGAARLLRALGPDAGPVWEQLTPSETQYITGRMNSLPTEDQQLDEATLETFLRDAIHSEEVGGTRPDWLDTVGGDASVLAALAGRESPQVAAYIMSRLDPKLAANVVRMLAPDISVTILKRLIDYTPPRADIAARIDARLADTLSRLATGQPAGGHERVARIFDQLDGRAETTLLAALDADAPGAGEKVRALMFTFNDLAGLHAAAMQTLLASTDRSVLTLALKGAREDVANVFYSNLTRRAGALIREEMAALGPIRRSEVEAARTEIVETARNLIRTGEIRLDDSETGAEDELVE